MRLPWFKLKGILYVPSSLMGWTISIFTILYAIFSFYRIDSRSHSASDTLMNFAFRLLLTGALYFFIAFITGRNKKQNIRALHP